MSVREFGRLLHEARVGENDRKVVSEMAAAVRLDDGSRWGNPPSHRSGRGSILAVAARQWDTRLAAVAGGGGVRPYVALRSQILNESKKIGTVDSKSSTL